jgi:DNA damage-binding protein 1
VLALDTHGDRVLVGDVMQSISVLSVTQKEPLKLDLLALDSKPNWLTAVKFVNDQVYIGADDRNNIFTMTYDEHAHPANSLYRLELQGGFHIGSLVNCFQPGKSANILYIFSN